MFNGNWNRKEGEMPLPLCLSKEIKWVLWGCFDEGATGATKDLQIYRRCVDQMVFLLFVAALGHVSGTNTTFPQAIAVQRMQAHFPVQLPIFLRSRDSAVFSFAESSQDLGLDPFCTLLWRKVCLRFPFGWLLPCTPSNHHRRVVNC